MARSRVPSPSMLISYRIRDYAEPRTTRLILLRRIEFFVHLISVSSTLFRRRWREWHTYSVVSANRKKMYPRFCTLFTYYSYVIRFSLHRESKWKQVQNSRRVDTSRREISISREKFVQLFLKLMNKRTSKGVPRNALISRLFVYIAWNGNGGYFTVKNDDKNAKYFTRNSGRVFFLGPIQVFPPSIRAITRYYAVKKKKLSRVLTNFINPFAHHGPVIMVPPRSDVVTLWLTMVR